MGQQLSMSEEMSVAIMETIIGASTTIVLINVKTVTPNRSNYFAWSAQFTTILHSNDVMISLIMLPQVTMCTTLPRYTKLGALDNVATCVCIWLEVSGVQSATKTAEAE